LSAHLVDKYGGVEAVRLLLRGRGTSDGFTTLWENGRLQAIRRMPAEQLAADLRRRGWAVVEP